jgi:hypothetical protein
VSELIPLNIRPGIYRESTRYANKGGWYDCNLVRFRENYPEKMGGWRRYTRQPMIGTSRSLFAWSLLGGAQLYASGTNFKYYLVQGTRVIDVTPIRRTVTLGTDPLTTVSAGSSLITVNDPDHGAAADAFVTLSGATGPIDGIPASEINAEHQIVEIVDSNNYRIQVTTTATAGSVSGGGSSVQADYQINPGLDTSVMGDGWGTGTYGAGGWGDPSGLLPPTDRFRLWSEDNFGEDLLLNPIDGGIYFKDVSGSLFDRAVNITSLSGSNQAPTVCRQVLVSDIDRHVLAFGCDPASDPGTQDLLLIRWGDAESMVEWEVRTDTSAGSLRIDDGSEIVRAIETSRETLVFTDTSLHSVRYQGPPFIFGQQRVAQHVGLIGRNAVVSDGSVTYWMERGRFQLYDGAVREIKCDIKDYIFRILNVSQNEKIYAGINREFSEVIWNIPVNDSEENNFYVVYNYLYRVWYYGFWPRTTWIDTQFLSNPLATAPDGYIYSHDDGADDGSTVPATALDSYIESSDIELGEGNRFLFMWRLLPDVTFDGSDGTFGSPGAIITLQRRDYPGDPYSSTESTVVRQTATVPIEQFDRVKNIRLRGRTISYRISSDQTGVQWRQGLPRIQVRADGRKS